MARCPHGWNVPPARVEACTVCPPRPFEPLPDRIVALAIYSAACVVLLAVDVARDAHSAARTARVGVWLARSARLRRIR